MDNIMKRQYCDACGKPVAQNLDEIQEQYRKYCDGVLTWDTNPYAVDVHHDYTEYLECEGQRYESGMNI